MAFVFIKNQLVRDNQKYEETKKKRAESGSKGGRPKKEEEEPNEEKAKKANGFSEKAKKANGFSEKQKKHNVDVDDNVDVYVDDNDIITHSVRDNSVRENDFYYTVAAEFEELWLLYPKKQGKEKASMEYMQARKNGQCDFETVKTGIKNYCDYIARSKLESRFIKQGGTFLECHAWIDEYPKDDSGTDFVGHGDYNELEALTR